MTLGQKVTMLLDDYMCDPALIREVGDLIADEACVEEPYQHMKDLLGHGITLEDIKANTACQKLGEGYYVLMIKREIAGKEVQFTLYTFVNPNK